MLTQQDLKSVGKIVKLEIKSELKPMLSDVDAIQIRIARLEDHQLTKIDLLRLESPLNKLEKRTTLVESKLNSVDSRLTSIEDKVITIEQNIVTKKEFKPFMSKINKLAKDVKAIIKIFDSNIVDVQKRTDRIEKHLDLPPVAAI